MVFSDADLGIFDPSIFPETADHSGYVSPLVSLQKELRLPTAWDTSDAPTARLPTTRRSLFDANDDEHAQALLQSTPHLRHFQSTGPERTFLWKHYDRNTQESVTDEYKASLARQRSHQQAAAELARWLGNLCHEMPLEDYGTVEAEVFTRVFALFHDTKDAERRLAGLAALDALLDAPSADEERKAIKFANALSNGLRVPNADYEFLSAVSRALGHMATKTANVDLVESEVTRALEWLRTERSDRRLAACLALKELARHAPTTFHSKTTHTSTFASTGSNEFLDHIFPAIWDVQPIVRVCAADALAQCLKILVQRKHTSLTGLLCQVHLNVMEGLQRDTSRPRMQWQAVAQARAAQHGSLLVVSTMLLYTGDFMLPRLEEVCSSVFQFFHADAIIRLEVVRLIPKLARRSPRVFARRYLEQTLQFLLDCVADTTTTNTIDVRPAAYEALGRLVVAMTDETTGHVIGGVHLPTVHISLQPDQEHASVQLSPHGIIHEKLPLLFDLVRLGLRPPSNSRTLRPALHCAANLVRALGDMAVPYIDPLIREIFRAGLSNDLIQCLHSLVQCVPEKQAEIENRMLQEVSVCLAGIGHVYEPLVSYRTGRLADPPRVVMNRDDKHETVQSLVLSLQTLASFGGGIIGRATQEGSSVPLLPFVQDVVALYLSHPSSEVRRTAALTCCMLLIPKGKTTKIGSYSGIIIEEVLGKLLRVAIADVSSVVRLCVIRALDSRYDSFLCQAHHLQELFLLLQDESLATRASGLTLLGRLGSINPAPILPVLRRFLNDLIVELQCGIDTGRSREETTRLLVVYLKAKPLQRLVHPVLASLVCAIPLDSTAAPRLASVSLEALGELAQATGVGLQPWVKNVVPHVLEIMQDQSSVSKQRTSLRTLGQIAGSTGYVVRPYLDYPALLPQSTEILPATKRAPWALRREVIRTLGILGALDPDRYYTVASQSRKGGAAGGAYFEENEESNNSVSWESPVAVRPSVEHSLVKQSRGGLNGIPGKGKHSVSDANPESTERDEEQPAYLSMYEQYAMVAQPVSSLPPAKRLTPNDEDFYPTVAIQALMRIFKDPNLAANHQVAIQAVMYIFKSLGTRCVPYLPRVVPYMLSAIRTCLPNLRESLLKQLATLSLIVREHLRPYVVDIFEVVEQFWGTRHLGTIFALTSNIAVGVPGEFRIFMPRLIKRLLSTLDEIQLGDRSSNENGRRDAITGERESQQLALILRSIISLRGVLGAYLHILIPALLKTGDSLATISLKDDSSQLVELSVLLYRTVSALLESQTVNIDTLSAATYMTEKFIAPKSSENGLPSRVVQPMVRIFNDKPPRNPSVGLAMIETLYICARLLGTSKWLQLYDDIVRYAIAKWEASFPTSSTDSQKYLVRFGDKHVTCSQVYNDMVAELQLPPPKRSQWLYSAGSDRRNLSSIEIGSTFAYESSVDAFDQSVTPLTHSTSVVSRQRVNQTNLQRAWDVSQRTSREDWDEWMRRFAIQLLREAPSPALRATTSLASAYQPLARELFSAAFACCWRELSGPYRENLVQALETAFKADVSPEILQALLNLAEFMEHDPSGGLPIDISILADLALKCRAYAKALHYKEREYSGGGSSSCVESLISINRKLDLQGEFLPL